MLTLEQEQWIAHLSDTKMAWVVPFDPSADEKFERVKRKIQDAIGSNYLIEHHGATSLGISGQDEIDVYIPVSLEKFDVLVMKLKESFGEPKSMYPLKRARFVAIEDNKQIDIFPINKESADWKNLLKFETVLQKNPDKLEEYRKLKEAGDGLSVREYYRRKVTFINQIIYEIHHHLHHASESESGQESG